MFALSDKILNFARMEQLPQDPIILLSYINTKLRDDYGNLDELCSALDIDRKALEDKLHAVGFDYDAANNRFA